MLVSVTVPIYEQLPMVMKLARSLLNNKQEMVGEVLLLDDHSQSFNLMELMGPPFSVMRADKNNGYVKTANAGGKMAHGKYLYFLNSDIEVHKVWLDPAVELMEKNDKIGVVGIKLVFPPNQNGEVLIQSCGGLYDIGRMPFHRYLGWLSTDSRVNQTGKVAWVTGAAFLTRKDLFDKIGGFDEAYGRGYFEEVDYCEKAKELGFEVWYCAEASATHYVGQSMTTKTDEEKRAASNSFYNNARRFEAKWYSKIVPDVQIQHVQY